MGTGVGIGDGVGDAPVGASFSVGEAVDWERRETSIIFLLCGISAALLLLDNNGVLIGSRALASNF